MTGAVSNVLNLLREATGRRCPPVSVIATAILGIMTASAISNLASAQTACVLTSGSGNPAAGFACGDQAGATGSDSSAIGIQSSATGTNSLAVGFQANAPQTGASAIGASSSANGTDATATGYQAHANAPQASAFGASSSAGGLRSSAFGYSSTALDYGATVGASSVAGIGGAALGTQALANGNYSIATGMNAQANATNSIAIGGASGAGPGFAAYIDAAATNGVAIGTGARVGASGANSIALGAGSIANVANTVSIGSVGSERKLLNLADGTIASGSTDAVNGGQIYTANQRVAAAFGTTLTNGVMNAPSYLIQSVTYNDVGSAFGAVDNALTANTSDIQGLNSAVAGLSATNRYIQFNGGGVPASAISVNSTAIGVHSRATAVNTTALGMDAYAPATNSVALGAGSVATVANAVSIGAVGSERKLVNLAAGTLSSTSTDAVNGSQLYGANQRVAAALGAAFDNSTGVMSAPSYTIQSVAYNNVASAFGAVDSALTANATSISNLQTQVNNGSIGLVQQNAATRALSVGGSTDGNVLDVSGASGNRTVAGVAAGAVTATSTDAVNGSQLYATNQQVATLTGQVATNTTAIASLNTTVAGLSQSNQYVKVNSSNAAANASGTDAIALGGNAQATQSGSVAIGLNSASTGVNAIAIGTGAVATGSVAVGAGASAGNGGAAFGDGAVATGSNAAALGTNASAAAANSVAIGSGSTNTVANTVSFGAAGNERRLTNVAAGISQTDAVNVGQLQSVAAGLQSQIGGLQNQITDNQREARRGIVAAVAVAPVLMPSAPGKTTVAVNTGYYRGEAGVGIGVSHRLNFSVPTVVYGSYSNGGGNEHVGRAGMAVEF